MAIEEFSQGTTKVSSWGRVLLCLIGAAPLVSQMFLASFTEKEQRSIEAGLQEVTKTHATSYV